MVKETNIHFDLSDIATIRLCCVCCPNEIVLRPGAECIPMPRQCANCGASWVHGNDTNDLTRRLVYLLSYIQSEVTGPPVNIQLELRDD